MLLKLRIFADALSENGTFTVNIELLPSGLFFFVTMSLYHLLVNDKQQTHYK